MMKTLHKRCVHLVRLIAVILAVGWCAECFAAGLFSSDDLEKPKPEFSRQGDRITAKFIPRAKSTSVELEFEVTTGGKIDAAKGMDFAAVDRPEVDIKNFKSAAFKIGIRDVARGKSATVAVRSDFFTLSTAFYVFNPKREKPWIENAQTENRALPERVRELIVQVRDGGDFDADGSADGYITLIGGPRDSFWGYALGTLFIRFFGIFIVLVLLMIGMIVSGWIFKALDRTGAPKPAIPEDLPGPGATTPPAVQSPIKEVHDKPSQVPEETVAAIAAALGLRDNASQIRRSGEAHSAERGKVWTLEGRKRIMNDRLMIFNHADRNKA